MAGLVADAEPEAWEAAFEGVEEVLDGVRLRLVPARGTELAEHPVEADFDH